MNSVERLLHEGITDRIAKSILPGETYFVGPSDVAGSVTEFTPEFRSAAAAIRKSAPEGARVIAWFCLKSDGTRLDGQIAADVAEGAPQVVWTLGEQAPELDYQQGRSISFPSDSDKLIAAAEPREALRHVGGPHDDATVELLTSLGYVPVLPLRADLNLNFTRLKLEPTHA